MSEINIYKMKLHEIVVTGESDLYTTIMRVPGGWIYRSYDKTNSLFSAVFVPYHNEFQI